MMRPLRPLLALAFATMACEVGSCGPRRPMPAAPATTASAQGSSAASPSAASAGAATTGATAAGPTAPFDLSSVVALTKHPALGEVRAALLAKDPKAAAQALAAALAQLSGRDLDRGRFLLGRLHQQAKDDAAAEKAYAAVAADHPLAPHAALRRAALLAKKGKHDEAIALLGAVPEAAPFLVDRHFVSADVLAAKGDHAGAAAAYALERRGPRGFDATVRWAEEVGAAGLPASALEAAGAVRRLRFEHPSSTLVPRMEAAEAACKALLPASAQAAFGPPTAAEEALSAQALLDAGKPKDALAIAQRLASSEAKGSDVFCRAASVVARAHDKLRARANASAAYGELEAACADEATRAVALYDGGKAALSARQPDLARARFGKLEKDYPKHRLADDARLRGATIAIESGDVAKGEAMLAALPGDYPQGDMRTEALFRLALPRMKAGDWAGARPWLEKSVALAPHEDGYFVAGRAPYFLARAKLETGAAADGVERLREVVAKEPLTFAAAMAYARLAARSAADAAVAKATLEKAMASEAAGALFDPARPELGTAAFARGVELARVGEPDLARKELAAAGLLEDAAKDPGAQWLVASILARVGEAKAAHGFPRTRLDEWTRHFPGGPWRAAWEIAFPRPFAELVEASAAAEGVPPTLLWAVMREESAFDPEAVSPSAAYGLLQLIVPTATRYAKPRKLPSDAHALLRPDVNVPLGAAYLRKLRGEFPENPGLAVPSYNAGEGATHKWLSPPLAGSFDLWVESIPYDETRKYTKRVLASYWAYVALYTPERLDAELRVAAGT